MYFLVLIYKVKIFGLVKINIVPWLYSQYYDVKPVKKLLKERETVYTVTSCEVFDTAGCEKNCENNKCESK